MITRLWHISQALRVHMHYFKNTIFIARYNLSQILDESVYVGGSTSVELADCS